MRQPLSRNAQRIEFKTLRSRLFWVIPALAFWLSLIGYWDSLSIYQNRFLPRQESLETVTFKILQASPCTSNFKVQFNDGSTQYLSFPNFERSNPKGGLCFKQVTYSDAKRLLGCTATAKINSVPWALFDTKQIWDLDCPAAGIHYGPDIAGSHVRENPLFKLTINLLFNSMMLVVCLGLIAVIVNVTNQARRQDRLQMESGPGSLDSTVRR